MMVLGLSFAFRDLLDHKRHIRRAEAHVEDQTTAKVQAVDGCEAANARTERQDLEAIAEAGYEAVDQADVQGAVERSTARDIKLIELRAGETPDLDIEHAGGCLGVVTGDGEAARREARVDLASARNIAGNCTKAGEAATLDIECGG